MKRILNFESNKKINLTKSFGPKRNRRTDRSTVLVEVKSVGRSIEKVEYMKMVEVQKRSYSSGENKKKLNN